MMKHVKNRFRKRGYRRQLQVRRGGTVDFTKSSDQRQRAIAAER